MITWIAAALAATVADHPYQADVDLPAQGVVLVDVPMELRHPSDPRDGSDLLLVDGRGRAVDFAVLDGRPVRRNVVGRRGDRQGPLSWRPDPDSVGDRFDVWVRERPVDGLSLTLRSVPSVADVTVSRVEADGRLTEVARRRVFRLHRGDRTDVPGPFLPGRYKLDVSAPRLLDDVDGYTLSQPALADDVLEVPMGPPRVQENGVAVYDVVLPRLLPVSSLTLYPEEDLFLRDVRIHTDSRVDARPDTLREELWALPPTGTIERVEIGSTSVSDTTLSLPDERVRLYQVAMSDGPLTIPRAEVSTQGLAIVVRDAGPGPHHLYGGALEEIPSRDMALGIDAMVRVLEGRAAPGEVEPNPHYEPPPVPGSELGPELDADGLSWRRPVVGDDRGGPVRIPLDDHVLVHARSDLGDLRLRVVPDADEPTRQLPYGLRRHPEQGLATDLPTSRVERGAESRIEVTLPRANLPLESLTLYTPGDGDALFDREVTVWRHVGEHRSVLRAARWSSATHPHRLTLGLGHRVGEELSITIANGDDPPLPVERVDVTWARWEVVAAPPEGVEVELLYGDAGRVAPHYDAGRVLLSVAEAPAADLGEPQALGRQVSPTERVAAIAGMGCVGAGVVVMLVLLVVTGPTRDEGDDEADEPEASVEPSTGEPEPGVHDDTAVTEEPDRGRVT